VTGRPVLGIDTSGTVGSVALLSPALATEEVFEEGLIHGVALAPSVAHLLEQASIDAADLAAVAVGLGPGSYTGVRVGVTFAKTLAFAAEVPVVGVSSLDAMAENAPHGERVVCARDARRGSLYARTYHRQPDGAVPEGPLRLLPLTGVRDTLPADALVIGDALDRFADLLSGDGRTPGDRDLWRSTAVAVARIGARLVHERGPDDPHDLAPIYLRASEAEERFGSA
jgi:tRNA threonylcarbamoyladenosine biosynthesis protein TsaB